MKIARFSIADGARFGVLNEETGRYHLLVGDPLYSGLTQSGKVISATEAHFLAPMLPRSKVVGFVEKFSTANQSGACANADYDLYLKPNTSVIGTDVPIIVPTWAESGKVEVSAQLGMIISRPCKDLMPHLVKEKEVVFGYVLVSAVNLPLPYANSSAKVFGFDTSCATGPILSTGMPEGEFEFTFNVGEQGYDATVMIDANEIAQRVSHASQVATLLPGDIVLTGPLGENIMASAGDEIVFENTMLGLLRNPVLK